VYGARQVGKTTLMLDIIRQLGLKTLLLDGDRRGDWWELLVSRDLEKIRLLVAGYEMVFIDEAQRIPEIGLTLKIILDNFQNIKVLVTGSSALNLASNVSEPLTGRAYTYKLYPISQQELRQTLTPFEQANVLEERMVFGSYPEIFSLEGQEAKRIYLDNLVNGYLYKDILELGNVRNSTKIADLLKLLAFQISSEVSVSEVGSALGLSKTAIERYIDLLEKSFVIFRLTGFSRNLRKEVSKMDKIFFYDTGVRNAVIGNLNILQNRDDGGKLWENFLIVERMKKQKYSSTLSAHYFWRLHSGAELDLVEETGGELAGFEFTLSEKHRAAPKSWIATYPRTTYKMINRNNWQEFV